MAQTQLPAGRDKERKRQKTSFGKRRKTLFFKAEKLFRQYRAEVFLMVRKDQKYYILSSSDDPTWPSSTADVKLQVSTPEAAEVR